VAVGSLREEIMKLNSLAAAAAMVLVGSLGGLVAGCGGGGGGDDDDEEDFDNDATGIWAGTLTPDGSTGVPVTVVVEPDGRFVAISSPVYMSGTGDVSGDRLSASAKGWAPAGITFANGSTSATFSLTGFLFEENRSESSYSGAGESGRIVMTYDTARSNRQSSLTTVAGSYVTTAGGALAINSSGSVTLNSPNGPNCIGNGTIRVRNASRNVYAWSLALSGCTSGNGNADGVAYLDDVGGTVNSRIIMLGATTEDPVGIIADK
jgi:hypothetical protein